MDMERIVRTSGLEEILKATEALNRRKRFLRYVRALLLTLARAPLPRQREGGSGELRFPLGERDSSSASLKR